MPEQRKDLICVECTHCFLPWSDFDVLFMFERESKYLCKKVIDPKRSHTSLITGRGKVVNWKCRDARRNSDVCGPEGKYWTPKDKKGLFKALTK